MLGKVLGLAYYYGMMVPGKKVSIRVWTFLIQSENSINNSNYKNQVLLFLSFSSEYVVKRGAGRFTIDPMC
jgi:hypothetical protein